MQCQCEKEVQNCKVWFKLSYTARSCDTAVDPVKCNNCKRWFPAPLSHSVQSRFPLWALRIKIFKTDPVQLKATHVNNLMLE